MSDDGPNELTILLRVVEVVELSLQKNCRFISDKNRDSDQIIQITNKFAPGSFIDSFLQQGSYNRKDTTVARDQYVTGQAGAVGPKSNAQNMTFSQIWSQKSSDIDLTQLATDLTALRAAMRERATEPDDDLALADVTRAQLAASKGDGPETLSHLERAGKWALSVAITIGAGVAAAAIKSALGL